MTSAKEIKTNNGSWKFTPDKGQKFTPKDFHPSFALNPPKVKIENRKGVYYHITPKENVSSILYNGLRSEHELIWLFEKTDRVTLLSVALIKNMDFQDFGIIEIDARGMTGFITTENYTGSTYKHIFIKQSLIESKYLKLKGIYSINLEKIN